MRKCLKKLAVATRGGHLKVLSPLPPAEEANFSDPLTKDIGDGDTKMPPLATTPPSQQSTLDNDGSSLPPSLLPKSMEGMTAFDHNGRTKLDSF
ncbi:Hypothetical predicted protein, partial [Olea europaea subsp. europaea]